MSSISELTEYQNFIFSADDTLLFTQSRQGNRDAYWLLLDRNIEKFLYFISDVDTNIDYGKLRDQVYETSWRLLDRVEEITRLPRFCRAIAVNIIRNERKKKKPVLIGNSLDSMSDFYSVPISDHALPENSILNDEESKILWTEIERLAPKDRQLIISRFVYNQTFDDMAENFGLSRSSVFDRFKKIIKKLANSRQLREYFGLTITPALLMDLMRESSTEVSVYKDLINNGGFFVGGAGIVKMAISVEKLFLSSLIFFFIPIIAALRGILDFVKYIPNSEMRSWFITRAFYSYLMMIFSPFIFMTGIYYFSKLFANTLSKSIRNYYGGTISHYSIIAIFVIFYFWSRYSYYKHWRNISTNTAVMNAGKNSTPVENVMADKNESAESDLSNDEDRVQCEDLKKKLYQKINRCTLFSAITIFLGIFYFVIDFINWPRNSLPFLCKHNLMDSLLWLFAFEGCHLFVWLNFRKVIGRMQYAYPFDLYTFGKKRLIRWMSIAGISISTLPLIYRVIFVSKHRILYFLFCLVLFGIWTVIVYYCNKKARLWPVIIAMFLLWIGIRFGVELINN